MAADMEESSGYTGKRTVNKLQPVDFFGQWATIIAGAGDSAVIDNATRRLTNEFAKITPFDEDKVYDALDRVLGDVHEKYIDPVPNHEGVELLVGIRSPMHTSLISTCKRTPKPEVAFACTGLGRDLANYFADKLFEQWDCTLEDTVKLAAFILKEVQHSVRSVGMGSQIGILTEVKNFPLYYGPDSLASAEMELPEFDDALKEFRRKLSAARPDTFRELRDK
jgi:20S proteasome alpha/beta subunit